MSIVSDTRGASLGRRPEVSKRDRYQPILTKLAEPAELAELS